MSVPELSLKIKCGPTDRMQSLLRISLIKKEEQLRVDNLNGQYTILASTDTFVKTEGV